MNCKIIVTDTFKKDAKKLLKKYASMKVELSELEKELLENPRIGTSIHKNIYKIRLSVKSKGKGKSGGLRVITYLTEVVNQEKEFQHIYDIAVFLAAIYDKSEMGNISDKDLKDIIEQINSNLDN
jgi:mRNA-degrading endonuclease RelE of RelBE toxin-antitoxin system